MSFSLGIMQFYCFCKTQLDVSSTFRRRMDIVCTIVSADMLVIILVTSVVITVSGQTNFQSKLWVTKILSNTLDDYVPDGGTVCKRHGIEYREGLKDLKLWATESEHDLNYTVCPK